MGTERMADCIAPSFDAAMMTAVAGLPGRPEAAFGSLPAVAHQESAPRFPCSSTQMVGATDGHGSVDLLARVEARETRSPSPASTYEGVRIPEHIADALNRTSRR